MADAPLHLARNKVSLPVITPRDTDPDNQTCKGVLCEGCAFADRPRLPGRSNVMAGPVDVLLISDTPSKLTVAEGVHYSGKGGRVIAQTWRDIAYSPQGRALKYDQLRWHRTYAVQCMSEDPAEVGSAVRTRCAHYARQAVEQLKPRVVLVFGAQALKILGIRGGKFEETRGRVLHGKTGSHEYLLVATFSTRALLDKSGLYRLFKSDLARTMQLATLQGEAAPPVTREQLTANYRFPKTLPEVATLIDEIIASKGPMPVAIRNPIAADIETNTRRPHAQGAKILCFSFAWGDGLSCAIPVAHRDWTAWTPGEVLPHIARLLASGKPMVFHGGQFDLKFIEGVYGLPVTYYGWDTLYGQHLLVEDQNKNYSLKIQSRTEYPEFAGYADNVHEDAARMSEARAVVERLIEAYKPRKWKRVGVRVALPPAAKKQARKKRSAQPSAQLNLFAPSLPPPTDPPADTRSYKLLYVLNPPGDEVLFGDAALIKPAELREELLGDKKTQKRLREDEVNYENVPLDELLVYGAIDTDLTRRLLKTQTRHMREDDFYAKGGELMRSHCLPLARTLGRMEHEGVRVDREYMEKLASGLRIAEADYLREMRRHWDPRWGAFNPNSSQQIGRLLYSEGVIDKDGRRRLRRYDLPIYTATKQFKTDKATLRGILERAQLEGSSCSFTEALLGYRAAEKCRGAFLDEIRYLSREDGRVHTNYLIHGTSTGRLASNQINLQNIPKKLAGWNIKKLFRADSDDDVFVNVDYKGAEVRIYAAYSEDEKLISALLGGMDPHCFFAAAVWGAREQFDYAEVLAAYMTPDKTQTPRQAKLSQLRSIVKRVVFGILYGAQARKIAETAKVSEKQAQEVIDLLFTLFPTIKYYVESTHREAEANGFVETKFGRRRRFPLYHISSFFRSQARRRAVNFKIQSTSSDIVLGQLVEVAEHLPEIEGRMKLTVHDSIGFCCPKKYVRQLPEFLQYWCTDRVAEKYAWLPVPFTCDIEVGPNYGETVPIDAYIKGLDAAERVDKLLDRHDNEVHAELRNFAEADEDLTLIQ